MLTLENTLLLCDLRALRVNPALFLKHANLKVGVPKRIAPSQKEKRVRRDDYMDKKTVRSILALFLEYTP